jgi:hypothetical protein
MEKVSFDGVMISGGIKSITEIKASTYILELSGSMSSDIFDHGSVSVIESSPKQLGPPGPRLILGPFRFINHDCNPNAQVSETYYQVI